MFVVVNFLLENIYFILKKHFHFICIHTVTEVTTVPGQILDRPSLDTTKPRHGHILDTEHILDTDIS